jgi:NADH-quinone oxidoreductase subunit L
MTVPLIILAGFAILLGVIGTPAWPWFDAYLNGELAELQIKFSNLAESAGLMGASALIVLTGITVGWILYGLRRVAVRFRGQMDFRRRGAGRQLHHARRGLALPADG